MSDSCFLPLVYPWMYSMCLHLPTNTQTSTLCLTLKTLFHTETHATTLSPQTLLNTLVVLHSIARSLLTLPLSLTSWLNKTPPNFSPLSGSHVPILDCSFPLNPTVADSINEVAFQPKALHNILITSGCRAWISCDALPACHRWLSASRAELMTANDCLPWQDRCYPPLPPHPSLQLLLLLSLYCFW